MQQKSLAVLAVLFWIPSLGFKFLLALIGLVVVPLTHPETNFIWGNREDPEPPSGYHTGKPQWLRDYLWRAIRNPANNLRFRTNEPMPHRVLSGFTNPDTMVRHKGLDSASRFARRGIFAEYWRVWRTKDPDRPIGEFRIGWKFSPVPGFAPTLQWRKGA